VLATAGKPARAATSVRAATLENRDNRVEVTSATAEMSLNLKNTSNSRIAATAGTTATALNPAKA
jgi:hypothetical protein